MATQRNTIVKIAGVSADVALKRLSAWSAARNTTDPSCWDPEQWPAQVRQEADEFVAQLRTNGLALPVCYFAEWLDMWSIGDLFPRWLTPPNCPGPISLLANRFEILAYGLPDGGRLADYLANAGPSQFSEAGWYIARLREAVNAWEKLAPNATLVVLRSVVGGSVMDEEVRASLRSRAQWLR